MRLIDADALGTDFCDGKGCNTCTGKNKICIYEVEYSMKDVFLWLEQQPTIDAVPVVRCKDCVYWDKDTLRHNSNDVAEWDECECEMLANRDRWNEIDRYCCDIHFCADGERKDND